MMRIAFCFLSFEQVSTEFEKRRKVPQRSGVRGFHPESLTGLHPVQGLLGPQQWHGALQPFQIKVLVSLNVHLYYPFLMAGEVYHGLDWCSWGGGMPGVMRRV